MPTNGLTTFSMHRSETARESTLATINEGVEQTAEVRSSLVPADLDPVSAARRYLNEMIASPAVPSLTADEPQVEFRVVDTQKLAVTGATAVKFAQYFDRIPVYGSLVTIELDEHNGLLSVSSAVTQRPDVDALAEISPAQASRIVGEHAGSADRTGEVPRLYFYYDDRPRTARWRLVYIARNVLDATSTESAETPEAGGGENAIVGAPQRYDYVVDADSGDLVARLPRTHTVTWTAAEETATDGLGHTRTIRVEKDPNGKRRLRDSVRNIQTFDFSFHTLRFEENRLPGTPIGAPPVPWSPAAVSAHANAMVVADFLVTVLRRDGVDGAGMALISSIDCLDDVPDVPKEWRNAAWIGTQMVYGQRNLNGKLRSYALGADVVAHEVTHGITQHTADLVYQRESGAMNESYSDIFGTIISNAGEPDIGRWDWRMGEDLSPTGVPLRDMSDPAKFGQPAHMHDFRVLPPDQVPDQRANDFGWVHRNSGIHNKAAFNLLTSRGTDGNFLFTPTEGAQLFYIALVQYLSRTSGFSDSRRGVELAALTLFRNDPDDVKAAKVAAVSKAFEDVGITDPTDPTA